MFGEKEKLLPKNNASNALKYLRKNGSLSKISRLSKTFNSFNKKTNFFGLIFIFLMCVKGLDGRPRVHGELESGETRGGSEVVGTTSPHPHVKHTKVKSTVKLAVPDGDVPSIQRYPVSQVDFEHVKTPFIIGAWILSAGIAKIAFHMTPQLHKFVPESCLLILVGVVVGIIMLFSTNVFVSPLTPNTFFLYMLPPIILDAGYFMPNRKFFDNLGTILLMAVVGTVFNIATIGGSLYLCGLTGIYGEDSTPGFLDIFLFASLISAVDPVAVLAVFEEIKVNEILYIVVFGESLLNDAVTVVMYHMMEAYDEIGVDNIIAQDIVSGLASFFVVALGGTLIGIIYGFLLGFITRFTNHVLIIEPIFVFLMAYLSYLNAEMFHMSGILAITFCGIVAKNYVESNISSKSQTTIKYALKMLSNSSETIIFMFLGVASVHSSHEWNTWFVLLTILFCSMFRALGVILFSALANRSRLHKLSGVDQFVMSYGGLRGAVAFALVLLIDERVIKQKDMFLTTTIAVIYFTVFLQGITIKPLVEILNVKRADKKELTMNERINERFTDHVMAGIEDIIGHNSGNYNLRDKFRRFNDRFIQPHLIRDIESAERKFLKTYSRLMLRDAMAIMQRSPSTLGQLLDTESLNGSLKKSATNCTVESADFRSRYIDINELDYYPSKRDIFDAEIHHLSVEPYRPLKNRPKNIKPKSRKDHSKTDDRTAKIRFRRYITNRKHLRFLQQASFHSDGSDRMQQNLVSFSDQQRGLDFPTSLKGVHNQIHNDDDDDVGLTMVLKKKNESRSLSQTSSIGDDLHCCESNSIHLPWRDSPNKAKNSMHKLAACDEINENNNCDKANNHLQDIIERKTNGLPHIDSQSSTISKKAQYDNKKSIRNKTSKINSMNENGCNGDSNSLDQKAA